MATEAEKRKLEEIRNDIARVGIDWSVEAGGDGILSLVVRDPADGEPRTVAVFSNDVPFSFQDFLMRAGDRQKFLLAMLDRCARAYRDLLSRQPKPKRYAAECAMKCRNDQAFRQYLIERHELRDAADFERIKTRMHSILNVASLNELDTDPAAAARWESLRKDFDKWRRHP